MAARSKSSPDVVSLSAFGFLFSELVQYSQNKIEHSADLEATLKEFGISVGRRVVEMHAFRSRSFKRETTIVGMLQFISNVIFKSLLGKTADNIQQSLNSNKEYMLHEKMGLPLPKWLKKNDSCAAMPYWKGRTGP